MMKKISICITMALAGVVGLSSCSESAQDKANDSLIAAEEEAQSVVDATAPTGDFTEEQYSDMIKYVGEYAEKAQNYLDMQNADPESAEAAEGLKALAAEYPEVDTYRNNIKNAPMDKMSEANIKEIGKYAGLIEFTAPAWYDIQTADPNMAAGLVMETPDASDSQAAGVVASPELQVEVKN